MFVLRKILISFYKLIIAIIFPNREQPKPVLKLNPYRELAEIPNVEPPKILEKPESRLTLKKQKENTINEIIEKILSIVKWTKKSEDSYIYNNITINRTMHTGREEKKGTWVSYNRYQKSRPGLFKYFFSLYVEEKKINYYEYYQEGSNKRHEEGDHRIKIIFDKAEQFVNDIEYAEELEKEKRRDEEARIKRENKLIKEVDILNKINNSLNI
jgi:hypothetical protein